MIDTLDKILDVKQREVATAREQRPMDVLRLQAELMPPCRNFYQAITKDNPRGINVIAEIKKASPSAGVIREDFDPVALARIYQAAGADALSVLTDETFFQGHLDYIQQVKKAVTLPVLRKDFIIDPYQVYEARVAGADAILLIAEALEKTNLLSLLYLAHSLTLTVLVEVHEAESLNRALSLIGGLENPNVLLGINNRNLKTMKTDLNHSLQMAGQVEHKQRLVSESGIKTRQDVQQLIAAGFNGILIGETLMRADGIGAKFAELFGGNG